MPPTMRTAQKRRTFAYERGTTLLLPCHHSGCPNKVDVAYRPLCRTKSRGKFSAQNTADNIFHSLAINAKNLYTAVLKPSQIQTCRVRFPRKRNGGGKIREGFTPGPCGGLKTDKRLRPSLYSDAAALVLKQFPQFVVQVPVVGLHNSLSLKRTSIVC